MCCLQVVRWRGHCAGDEWKEILVVVVLKKRWSWWRGRYGEGGAV